MEEHIITYSVTGTKTEMKFSENETKKYISWNQKLTFWSAKVIIVQHRIIWSWYTSCWWYSEEIGQGRRPLLVIPNISPPINSQCTNHHIHIRFWCAHNRLNYYKNMIDICWIVWQAEIAKLGYEEGKEEKLLAEKKKVSHERQVLQEKLECLEAK